MGEREWERARIAMQNEPETASLLYEELGRLLASWNEAEKSTRVALQLMNHSSPVAEITVAKLDAYGVEDTLRAAAELELFADIRTSLKDFSEEFAALREVRNHYVHGSCLYGATGEPLGLELRNKNVRAKLRVLNTAVSRYDIYLTAEAALSLGMWATEIGSWLLLARTVKPSASPQRPRIPEYRKVGYRSPK